MFKNFIYANLSCESTNYYRFIYINNILIIIKYIQVFFKNYLLFEELDIDRKSLFNMADIPSDIRQRKYVCKKKNIDS